MTTIGEQLQKEKAEATAKRIARQSDLLRKFVKEDLLASLQKTIAQDYPIALSALEAPSEIRYLFAAPLDRGYGSPSTDVHSAYYPVWCELRQWADSEGLQIITGHNFDQDRYPGTPWDMRAWGGRLDLKLPEPVKPVPVKPTPPASQKVQTGASISLVEFFSLLAVGMAVMCLILIFAGR